MMQYNEDNGSGKDWFPVTNSESYYDLTSYLHLKSSALSMILNLDLLFSPSIISFAFLYFIVLSTSRPSSSVVFIQPTGSSCHLHFLAHGTQAHRLTSQFLVQMGVQVVGKSGMFERK